MRAVAHGLFGGGFALAKINIAVFFSSKVPSFENTTFMWLVANWEEQMDGVILFMTSKICLWVFSAVGKKTIRPKKPRPRAGFDLLSAKLTEGFQ